MKIDKNVPLPARIANRVNIGPLPLADLQVGDSVLIECDLDETQKILHAVRVRLSRFAKSNKGFKFSSSPEKKGVRVWRV
ncbi:hypothetical protein EBT31_18900 [bacterium]|jgi:hypothetical protein|nr:hypothetical protein [bacterium]